MHGMVTGFANRGRIVAATGAAYSKRVASFGCVVSDGRWILGRYDDVEQRFGSIGPSAALVAELHAVTLLLESPAPLPAVLLVHNALAARFLHAWQRGESDRMPMGYRLRERRSPAAGIPTLVRLSTLMIEHPGIWIERVRPRKSHPLNEAAHALASLAMRELPADETRSRTEHLAQAFLTQWHDQDRP